MNKMKKIWFKSAFLAMVVYDILWRLSGYLSVDHGV